MQVNSPARDSASATTTDQVFDKLLQQIVGGIYPPGVRLPAERDLAVKLGASRPTLREALRRLAEWNLVEAKRGSGIVVRDLQDWMIEVLPAYLRFAPRTPGRPTVVQLVSDLAYLRRTVSVEIIGMACGRLPAGGTSEARALVAEAWKQRSSPATYGDADLGVTRSVVYAANLYVAVWTVNRLRGIYHEMTRTLGEAVQLPDDYVDSYTTVLDALENGDRDTATGVLNDYFLRHDEHMLGMLRMFE